jgi:hypothetical protein
MLDNSKKLNKSAITKIFRRNNGINYYYGINYYFLLNKLSNIKMANNFFLINSNKFSFYQIHFNIKEYLKYLTIKSFE